MWGNELELSTLNQLAHALLGWKYHFIFPSSHYMLHYEKFLMLQVHGLEGKRFKQLIAVAQFFC